MEIVSFMSTTHSFFMLRNFSVDLSDKKRGNVLQSVLRRDSIILVITLEFDHYRYNLDFSVYILASFRKLCRDVPIHSRGFLWHTLHTSHVI